MNTKPHISDPCHQPWDRMTPDADGRHCGSCNKIVVDFRGKSNQEILATLKQGGKPCGLFDAKQLSAAPREGVSFRGWRRFAAVSIAVIGFSLAGSGQTAAHPLTEKYPDKVCPVEDSPGYVKPAPKVHWWQFRKKRRNRHVVQGRYIGYFEVLTF